MSTTWVREEFDIDPPNGQLFHRDLYVDVSSPRKRAEYLAGAFLASYKNQRTRDAYRTALHQWLLFLAAQDVADPIADVRRHHGDVYARFLDGRRLSNRTIYRRLSILQTFYQYVVDEEYLERNPFIRVVRPTLPRESTRAWMGARELARWLEIAEGFGGYPFALCSLLALNALRVSEATAADVEGLGQDRHHPTLKIWRKGDQPSIVPLAPQTKYAIDKALAGRTRGPLLLNRDGTRMQRDAAGRIVKRVSIAAGINKHITPHSLRHSSLTAHYMATKDVHATQRFAGHMDVRTTLQYTHAQDRLDTHGTYVVASHIAGAD